LRHLGSNENDAVGGSLAGKRVAALGQAFKPNSDDVRDSPSLDVCGRLAAEGAIVSAHDPVALQNASRLRPDLRYAKSVHRGAVREPQGRSRQLSTPPMCEAGLP